MGDSGPQPVYSRPVDELALEFTSDVTEKLRKLEIKTTKKHEYVAGASALDAQEFEARVPNTRELSSSAFRRRQPTAMTKYPSRNPDHSMNFPFLHDPQTVKLVQKSKVLFIMRGVPGSGKSTIAKAIEETYDSTVVCSANDYFMRNGEYKFDVAGLGPAHAACRRKAEKACSDDVAAVVVDNTNVQKWEMKFYLELAGRWKYVALLVEPRTSWKRNPAELEVRNIHGLSAGNLRGKLEKFEDAIPIYYGWFLNESDSKDVFVIARGLLQECAIRFPGFKDRLQRSRGARGGSVSPSAVTGPARDVLWKHYTNGKRVDDLLHCTAMYCGNDPSFRVRTGYHSQRKEDNSLGQASQLEIPSMCFTPRSISARVLLTKDQLSFFDKPEESNWNGNELRAAGSARAMRSRQGHQEPACSTKPLAKANGRSAHITIGSGPGIQPMVTTSDVLRLCDMEDELKPGCGSDFVPVTGGQARYFSDGVCCVYFNPHRHVSSIYSGFYDMRGAF